MRTYDKRYASKEEYKFRLGQFTKNVQIVEDNNYRSNSTNKMSMNKYSDLTEEEFDNMLPAFPEKNVSEPRRHFNCSPELGCNLAPYVNWTERGYITAVKETPDHCLGASYAFVAADTVEATYYNATKRSIVLSPQ